MTTRRTSRCAPSPARWSGTCGRWRAPRAGGSSQQTPPRVMITPRRAMGGLAMAGESATRSGGFWTSLPGVLTGIAALLSAAGGVYAITRQQGGTGGASAATSVNSQDHAVAPTQSAPAEAIASPPVKVDASPPPAPVAPEPVVH